MITISTTCQREARAMAALLSVVPADLEWKVYLLGREVVPEELLRPVCPKCGTAGCLEDKVPDF